MANPHRSSEFQRKLDRRLGIPLVALVGMLRRRHDLPPSPRRIGLVQPTAIGDLILDSGLLLHLRRTHPASELHLFVGRANFPAVELLPVAVAAHVGDFKNIVATAHAYRAARLDVLIDLSPWSRVTALSAALSGACTVGFAPEGEGRAPAFDIPIPYSHAVHETENLRRLASCFAPCASYELGIAADLAAAPADLPYDHLILCHVSPGGSRAREKSWPAQYWAELARRLAARGYVLGFTGSDADAERVRAVLDRAALPAQSAFSLCGRLDLRQLAGALCRARLLVSVDTGPLHLAAALNAPVVGLHGPTRAARWGSRSTRAIGLDSPHPAAGRISLGFETSPAGGEIMAALRVDAVEEAVLHALEAAPAGRGEDSIAGMGGDAAIHG